MSLTDIERGLVARYVLRVLERDHLPLRATRHVLGWLKERASPLSLPVPKPLNKAVGNMYSLQFSVRDLQKTYAIHRDEVLKMLKKAAEQTPQPEPLASNIRMLVDELELPDGAWKIAGLIACYTRYEQVEYLCDSVGEVAGPLPKATSFLVGEQVREVEQLMSPLGPMVSSGLLQIKEQGDQLAGSMGRYKIPWRIDLVLDQTFSNFQQMRKALFGLSHEPSLALSDYEHVASDAELIVGVLRGAVKNKAQGVNILLYGPPGSGKTELTKVAAAAAGLSLYSAGEETSSVEGESDRSGRLSDLVFVQRLMGSAKKTALLFDEMEDIAWQLINRGGSKLYLNRVLESNPMPVLWTSNSIGEIDPAVLRRMTLAIELKQPPSRQRERIIARLDKRIGVGLSQEEVKDLARRIDTTPAILENALRAAYFSGGGKEAVERAALGVTRAITGGHSRQMSINHDFDPALTCASLDLDALTGKLKKSKKVTFSLLLSGPPGTGKSAYARYLAQKLGLEVIHKRASDLLGMFVGESEKLIADAFETARESKALLVFDEAESFLLDRRDAVRSWEITQVNEMLTWMEDHPYPVVCTTNLHDRLDRASMRRFTFNVRFLYLDKPALERAYSVFFQMNDVAPVGLELSNLTPGDFAQARRQADVLGMMSQPDKIIGLLQEISRAKPGTFNSIGFMR